MNLSFGVLLLLLVGLVKGVQYKNCIVLDPKDQTTFEYWKPCADGSETFTIKAYAELPMAPFKDDSQFAFVADSAGTFCIETDYTTVPAENLKVDIVYLVMSTDPESTVAKFRLYNDEDEENALTEFDLADLNEFTELSDSVETFSTFKVSLLRW